MEKVVLELIKDSGIRRDYKVFGGVDIRVGRGYANDFIIADPYVSEHHCVIHAHEEGFTIEDLSSANGTHINGKAKIEKEAPLRSGDEVTIGRTRLRFLVAGHPVLPALALAVPSAFFQEINQPGKAWLIVASALLLSSAIEHQESYKNMPLSKFISMGIGLLLIILVWAGVWAFVGRLIKHRSNFNAQLSWAALFFLAMTFFYPLAAHCGYWASSFVVEMAVGSVISWVFLSFLIAGHLTIATFISRRNQIIAATIISTVIIFFGIVTYYAGKTEFDPQPDFYSTLVPPYANIVHGGSMDDFLRKSEKVFLPVSSLATNGLSAKTNGQ